MPLTYLDFDYSEDEYGLGTFEAVASTWPEQVAAVHAEIARVLDWAHGVYPGRQGPVDDGGDWNYDLHGLLEFTAPETILYDERSHQFSVQAGPAGKPRHTVTLAVSGSPGFCLAFRQRFGLTERNQAGRWCRPGTGGAP